MNSRDPRLLKVNLETTKSSNSPTKTVPDCLQNSLQCSSMPSNYQPSPSSVQYQQMSPQPPPQAFSYPPPHNLIPYHNYSNLYIQQHFFHCNNFQAFGNDIRYACPPPFATNSSNFANGHNIVHYSMPPPNFNASVPPPNIFSSNVKTLSQTLPLSTDIYFTKQSPTSAVQTELSTDYSSSRSRPSRWSTSNVTTSLDEPLRMRQRSRSRDRIRTRAPERGSLNRKCTTATVSSSLPSPLDSTREYKKRQVLVEKWRLSNCQNEEELGQRLEALSHMNVEELMEEEAKFWMRSAPAHSFYDRDKINLSRMNGTKKLIDLCNEFDEALIQRGRRKRKELQNLVPPRIPRRPLRKCRHQCFNACSSDSSESDEPGGEENIIMEELERKMSHPLRLHRELWYNEPGEMNDGPLCKCSMKARRSGIRHGIYPGEDKDYYKCDPNSNNADKLYHYRITISPPTNFLSKAPTIIEYDNHEFIFGGFSLLSHYPLPKLPVCKVIRFNIEYTILYVSEPLPENFTIRECNLFFDYLFREILELADLDFYASDDESAKCPPFHFMPRFERELPEEGRELLPMSVILRYLLKSNEILIGRNDLESIHRMSEGQWRDFADNIKGMILTKPGSKPCSIRVDQLDRNVDDPVSKEVKYPYPEIIHFGIRPPQLSYAGNPEYQKAWREYVKCRHLIANLSKPTQKDKDKLTQKELELQKMRTRSTLKRDVTATVSSETFFKTGLMCDIVQHAMLIPVLVCHLRFHRSLNVLEESIGYTFKNRGLLQLALTHPSYRENFGTNPDHARNTLSNCGIRQPLYGDRKIHFASTKKRGINTLINIMSRFGNKRETESNIYHNERLEFLGDAVVEFAATIHLFHLFRDLEEGGLATYRAALVQNQHLAILAKNLKLGDYLLYAHGSDLCHDLELKHALANCFEALMGALFLDGGVEVPDRVFGRTIFGNNSDRLDTWENYPPHPLQEQEPDGDRTWIGKIDYLKTLTKFEDITNIKFTHIRLLARAFTDRSVGYTHLTLGSNQRLEFLGDSVLQLVASEYLYKHFPDHHEGHLSLLRSSLVNNKTQSVVCDDLGMTTYASYAPTKSDLKIKDKADLLEAFLGALYVDTRSLDYIRVFCNVCFFPRLQYFIMNQEWNDPKSKLQQCCLTLRTMDGGEPDIPYYKVVECKGPTNTRSYTVAVYFREKRLAKATGHSIQQAEMNAAQAAMDACGRLFPQLDHQKRVIAKSVKTQGWQGRSSSHRRSRSSSPHAPKTYRRSRSKSPRYDKRRKGRTETGKWAKSRERSSSRESSPLCKRSSLFSKKATLSPMRRRSLSRSPKSSRSTSGESSPPKKKHKYRIKALRKSRERSSSRDTRKSLSPLSKNYQLSDSDFRSRSDSISSSSSYSDSD